MQLSNVGSNRAVATKLGSHEAFDVEEISESCQSTEVSLEMPDVEMVACESRKRSH